MVFIKEPDDEVNVGSGSVAGNVIAVPLLNPDPRAADNDNEYTPATPIPLAVNAPTTMKVNSFTCKIVLNDGVSASKQGGMVTDKVSGSFSTDGRFLKSATVVLRLSAPPKELAA